MPRRLEFLFACHGKTCPVHVKELFGRVVYLALSNLDTLQLQDEAY
jgi:hypothetical protein